MLRCFISSFALGVAQFLGDFPEMAQLKHAEPGKRYIWLGLWIEAHRHLAVGRGDPRAAFEHPLTFTAAAILRC